MRGRTAQQVARTGARPPSNPPAMPGPGRDQSGAPDPLILQLPAWGRVVSITAERGFGHLCGSDPRERYFFHFSARWPKYATGRSEPGNGDSVLFILGTDPRAPEVRRVVGWARVADLAWGAWTPPTDQKGLDALRRTALDTVPLADLWDLMRADWYAKTWQGQSVPRDLEDSILAEVWLARIREMSPQQLGSDRAGHKLAGSRYRRTGAWSTGRLLDSCALPQLAAMDIPRAEWLVGASAEHQQRLVKWMLLGGKGQVPDDWQPWFASSALYAPGVAEYLIEQGLRPDATTRPWVRRLICQGLLGRTLVERWVGEDEAEAVALFEWLSPPRRQHFWSVWRNDRSRLGAAMGETADATMICRLGALAVDLETDGKLIRQVGCATADQVELIFDADSGGTDLDRAMQLLAARMQAATLVVGHNVLAWDWPVIRRQVDALAPPAIWDTLLVQLLLEPQATSHGLGSNHQAHDDAEAARLLFERQCIRVPRTWAASLLAGELSDERQLLGHLIVSLTGTLDYARPAPPWLQRAGDVGPVQVLPDDQMHQVDWVPGVTVVRAHPRDNLTRAFLQIDADLLAQALTWGIRARSVRPGVAGRGPRGRQTGHRAACRNDPALASGRQG
jgi:hypothetical protein